VAARFVKLVRHGFLHPSVGGPATLPFEHEDHQSGIRLLDIPFISQNDGHYPGIYAPTRDKAEIAVSPVGLAVPSGRGHTPRS
jgi:hypothetical protein